MTGRPPKVYRVPVPDEDGSTATVLVYRLRASRTNRLGLPGGWHYAFDPSGRPPEGPRWPWSRPRTAPADAGDPAAGPAPAGHDPAPPDDPPATGPGRPG